MNNDELIQLICNVCQMIDSATSTGCEWSDWDKEQRIKLGEYLSSLYCKPPQDSRVCEVEGQQREDKFCGIPMNSTEVEAKLAEYGYYRHPPKLVGEPEWPEVCDMDLITPDARYGAEKMLWFCKSAFEQWRKKNGN